MPLKLEVVSRNASLFGARRSIEFASCGGTLGRKNDNDWVFPDPNRYVSSRHALIDFQGGAYYIVDTSRNGVYVNGSDMPVGKGHPQRLFDNDVLRIGDYEIKVSIQETDEDPADDGMRDSVVRAQLADEDESVEMSLVDENQISEEDALAELIGETAGGKYIAEDIAESSASLAVNLAERRAVNKLLQAAGLKPGDVPGIAPAEVMEVTGQILRAMVTGLTGLLQERAHMKEVFRISQTAIRPSQNNPLKFSPSVEDAMKQLLTNRGDTFMDATRAIEAGFADATLHEKALVKAMQRALGDYIERFDPDELRNRFEADGTRRPLLGGSNKSRCWDLYEASYQTLTQQHAAGALPDLFSQEFARAYEEEVALSRSGPRPGSS